MLDSHAFVIYRTQYLLVFYFPFVVISLNWMGVFNFKKCCSTGNKEILPHVSLLVAFD